MLTAPPAGLANYQYEVIIPVLGANINGKHVQMKSAVVRRFTRGGGAAGWLHPGLTAWERGRPGWPLMRARRPRSQPLCSCLCGRDARDPGHFALSCGRDARDPGGAILNPGFLEVVDDVAEPAVRPAQVHRDPRGWQATASAQAYCRGSPAEAGRCCVPSSRDRPSRQAHENTFFLQITPAWQTGSVFRRHS